MKPEITRLRNDVNACIGAFKALGSAPDPDCPEDKTVLGLDREGESENDKAKKRTLSFKDSFSVMSRLLPCFFMLPVVHGQQIGTPDHVIYSPPTGKEPNIRQGSAVAIASGYRLTGCPLDEVGGGNSGGNVGSVKVYDSNANFLYQLQRSDMAVNDGFGARLAASGNLVAVGAPGKTVNGQSAAGVVYIYDVTSPSAPLATLAPPSSVAAQNFGDSIAMSGRIVVVGLPKRSVEGYSNAGAVLVYDIVDPAVPILLHTLTKPSPPNSGEKFGSSVAIDGRKIVIGAPYVASSIGSTSYANVGQAFVFNLDSPTPARPILMLPNANTVPNAIANDLFGSSVGISGSVVAVGAIYGENNTGAVYAYDLSSGSPTVPKTLVDPNASTAAFGEFGACLAVYGNYIAVGAPAESVAGKTGAGAAFTFDISRANPYIATFNNPAVNPQNGHLGSSIALFGNTVMTGVPEDDTEATDAGLAYQFTVGGTAANRIFKATSPSTADRFGTSVATAGDVIAVGAPNDPTSGRLVGSVRVYSRTGTTPAWTISVPASDLSNTSGFGIAVAMSGNRIAISSEYTDNGYYRGRIYIYDTANNKTSPLAVLDNPQPAAMGGFGYTLAMSGNRVLAGVRYPNGNTGGAVVFDLSHSSVTPWVTLVNPSPGNADGFGSALAIDGDTVAIGAAGVSGFVGFGACYLYNVGAQAPNRAFSIATITNPFPIVNDRFGSGLALKGSRLFVSGSGMLGNVATRRVYLFDLAGPSFVTPVLTIMNPGNSASFGAPLAFSGELLAVGAPQDSTGATGAGRGYLYSMASPTPAVPIRLLNNPSPQQQESFTNSLALEGDLLVSAAYQDSTIASLKGASYVYYLSESLNLVADPPVGGSISGGGTFTIGSPRTISVTPTGGWEFLRWSDGVTTRSRTIATPADGRAFIAFFRPSSYLAWRSYHFTAQQNADPAFSGSEATPFHDGVSNLLKFFFNIFPGGPMTPADYAALPVPHVENTGGTSYLTLSFRRNGIATDLTGRLEELGGTGAGSWIMLTPDLVTTTTDSATGDQTVTMKVVMTGKKRRIIRLKVDSLSP